MALPAGERKTQEKAEDRQEASCPLGVPVGRILRYLKKNKSLPLRARQQTHPKRSTARPHATRPQKGSRPHHPERECRPTPCFWTISPVAGSISGRSAIRSRNRRLPPNSSPPLRRATCGRPSDAFLGPSRSSSGGPTDNGTEFRGVLEELLREHSVAMQVIPPRSPKQNGCVGRCPHTWAQGAL